MYLLCVFAVFFVLYGAVLNLLLFDVVAIRICNTSSLYILQGQVRVDVISTEPPMQVPFT